jgi:hypothetical protein
MKTVVWRSITIASLAVILAIPVTAQQPAKSGKASQLFQEREKAVQVLAADSKRILGSLKTLTQEQRNAVIALMAVTSATAAYESRFMKNDDPSLSALYGSLGQFSPAYRAPAKFNQRLMAACFDQTVSCLSAQKKCLDGGGKRDQCDRDYKVIEACGNEAACFTSEFMKLHQWIPQILGGRDPWPPQPFPY